MFKVHKIWFIIKTAHFEIDLKLNDVLIRSKIEPEEAKRIIKWMEGKTVIQTDPEKIGYLFSE